MEQASVSPAEWELSKENIQPLKGGRKASKLANILQPRDEETQKLLQEERQNFETELRSYNGPDPLDPWYRYIAWVEQEYPKGGKEGNVHELIQKCIKKFKDEKSVQNDARFLDIWLKYAAISSQPLEVYDFMYKQGVCSQQGGLYEAWAWQLERVSSYKKAEGVFVKGIGAMVDPELKQKLMRKQKQFQARVIRRMNGEEISEVEVEEEQRAALGQLRGHGKKSKVGSVRVGSAKLGGPGVLPVAGGVPAKQPLGTNNGQGGFAIFSDENSAPPAVPRGGAASGQSIPSSRDRKENEMSAGQWGKAKVMKGGNVPLSSISQHAKPAFTVYEEPNLAQPTMTPQRQQPAQQNVLSTRKEKAEDHGAVHCPVALFEPADPTKRPMYCKDKVYQGTTEFSFEEFRAIRWKEKQRVRDEADSIERRKAELVEMETKLREQQEAMARQMAEFQRMMAGGTSTLMQGTPGVVLTRPSTSSESSMEQGSGGAPFTVYSDENSSSDSQVTNSRSDNSRSQQTIRSQDNSLVNSYPSLTRQPSLDSTAALISANPTGARNKFGTTPSPHGMKGQTPITHPSPTVNTKEAMAVMQQLWSKPVGEEDTEPQPLSQVPSSAPFQIFTDSTEPALVAPTSAPFQIFSDSTEPAAAAPFPIFSDSTAPQSAKQALANPKSRAAQYNKLSDKENSPVSVDGMEDRENCLPAGYSQPPLGVRTKTGVLTQAANIEYMPLEEQERLLDEDEKRQEEELLRFQPPPPKPTMAQPFAANQTIALPNEDDFERMAKMSSTPFTGKPAFYCDQDENTCSVDIVYKSLSNTMGPPAPPSTSMYDQEADARYSQPDRVALDTIAETSREYYKSSSSSSGGDTLHQASNRSHWGNTGTTQLHSQGNKTTDSTTGLSLARTPGQHLGGVSSVSGYLGDKSNMTKSGVKMNEKRELLASPQIVPYDKRMKMANSPRQEEDAFDEPTGMFSDMMAEYKQNLAGPTKKYDDDHETSLQASFVDPGTRDRTGCNSTAVHGMETSGAHSKTGLNMTGAPNFNMTGAAPNFNMTGAAPSLNITGAVPSLNMTGATPNLNMTGAAPSLNVTGAVPSLNMTAAAPSLNMTAGVPNLNMTSGVPHLNMTEAAPALDLSGAPEDLAELTSNLSLDDTLDPFHPNTHAKLLSTLPTPISSMHGYVAFDGRLPQVRVKSMLTLGEDVFYVSECKGEGGFAKVYAATRQDTDMDCTISGIDAVLKVQKPANDWEFYMCKEVEKRLDKDLLHGFMSIPRNYSFSDGGIFVSYHQKLGTLLDIINLTKTAGVQKSCIEPMAIYFTLEMLTMIENLHEAGILHADIKADNFLLQNIPTPDMAAGSAEEMFRNQPLSLQLIDFGRAIDLTLLPKDIFFTQVVKTDGIKNIEMREGKPWREQIDYFGVCATAYCLLFGTYMEVVKVGERWEVKGSYKRWWQVDMWKQFFNEFLNIKGLEKVCSIKLLKLVFIILFSSRNISLTFPSGVLGSSKYSLKRTWPSCCRG
eukprot:TRINITY_DN8444_c0_g1_i3.p1 TRINITY_DN8444_c0_g1~~TRINITY_DN8444_c0_g1_i3.p1  ORF type:complete len:1504 (-),score=632.87 TRINITY_DN8444_c0_g1_i3:217-4728(-)